MIMHEMGKSMDILDGILEKENRFIKKVLRLKNEGDKIYIWGNGTMGKQVRRTLALHGIKYDGTVVNRKYYTEGAGVFCFEEMMEKTDRPVSLIVAFRDWKPESMESRKCYKEKIHMAISMDGWAGPDIAGDGSELTYEWLEKKGESFQVLFNTLQDELSHRTLLAYLNQKISADYKYLDPVKQPFQYFDPEINKMSEHEVFVDCGAYDGDTALNFIQALQKRGYKSYDEIISFEPDPDNFRKLKARNLENHTCIPRGVSDSQKTLRFSQDDISSRCAESGEIIVEVDSIDHVMDGRRVTMLKMDIEGAELDALHGAKETIQKYKPLLAVCVYHRREDLLTIPQYIKSLVPEYRLFLRAYDRTATELVLYAVL